ncbi:hypothetical protein K8I61_02105 [bacterium]|nr:hypothetical protein [bacterium]
MKIDTQDRIDENVPEKLPRLAQTRKMLLRRAAAFKTRSSADAPTESDALRLLRGTVRLQHDCGRKLLPQGEVLPREMIDTYVECSAAATEALGAFALRLTSGGERTV